MVNNFALALSADTLRQFAEYIWDEDLLFEYDPHLLTGAADTVDQYLEDNNIVLLEKQDEKSKKETKSATDAHTDSKTGGTKFPD